MARLGFVDALGSVKGFRAMGVATGVKSGDRPDLALIVNDGPAPAGALVTTQNAFAAAPVHLARQHAANGVLRAVVVNAGNANACTGRQGLRDALAMARRTGERLGIPAEDVLVASTGIIGRPMPMDQVLGGIDDCAARLDEAVGGEAAQAILTTDSGPKQAMRSCEIDGREIHVGGIAKGAGMIHPNMATMLAFLTTDAVVDAKHLHAALVHATDRSFNQISVDGDESTNDMAALLASGAAGGDPIAPGGPAWDAFTDAVAGVCTDLAKQIAADGEGATRLLEVVVEGAADDADARTAARAAVSSDLVKCAVHGADPNWGRVLAAIGQSRVPLDPEAVSLWVGPADDEVPLLQDGTPVGNLDEGHKRMSTSTVRMRLSIGDGPGQGRAWGCDLTNDYVTFNAEYAT